MEREIVAAQRERSSQWVALMASEIRGTLPALPDYAVHRVPTASWVRPKFVERLFASGVRGVLVVRDARGEAAARDGGRWVAARLAGERKPVLRPERTAGGTWCVIDFDPSRPAELARVAQEFRRGPVLHPAVSNRTKLIAALAVAAVLTVAAIAPSHLRVVNPAPPAAELVLSIKAFGARSVPTAPTNSFPGTTPALALDAAEAAKPVHMRGVVTTKPHRADVVVKLTIDGKTQERAFPAKGLSHDGPAIGEWRTLWNEGTHDVVIEIVRGGAEPVARWSGSLRAMQRRLNVVMYDPNMGFDAQ